MADIFDLTDTWNDGGTTFTAIKMNVTDTASASGSLLLDLQVGGTSKLSVSKAGALTLQSDVILDRDAANTLALRNSTNAQAFNVYNTYTDASNYERGSVGWTGNELTIQSENAGTGSARGINIQAVGQTIEFNGNTVRINSGSFDLKNNSTSRAADIAFTEMTAPTGAANNAKVYAEDNGAGKTRLMVIFGSGAAQQIAIEP